MRTDVQTYGILIASGDSPPIAVTLFASREPSDWHFFARFYAKQAEYVRFYACVIIYASGDNASAGPEILLASGLNGLGVPGRSNTRPKPMTSVMLKSGRFYVTCSAIPNN